MSHECFLQPILVRLGKTKNCQVVSDLEALTLIERCCFEVLPPVTIFLSVKDIFIRNTQIYLISNSVVPAGIVV